MSPRTAALLALLVVVLTAIGCTTPPSSLWVDPGTIRFTPEHTRATIEIHNPGQVGRPIRDIRLTGPDWDALRIIEDDLPRSMTGGDVAILTLEVSPGKFSTKAQPGRAGAWRAGHATLAFESAGDHHEIAIEFAPESQPRGSVGLAVLIAVALTIAAGGIGLVRAGRPTGSRSSAGRFGLALAFTGLSASAALLPLGPAWCSGRLGAAVGPVELDQCRAGLGGHALIGWAGQPSFAWLLVALAATTIGRVLHLQALPAAHAGKPTRLVVRLLGFGLLIAAVVASLGASELVDLVLAQRQTIDLGTLSLPRLGVFVQPLAFVLALLLVADANPSEPDRQLGPALLARVDDLVWSALIVVLFLGSGARPGLTGAGFPSLLHGPELVLAALAFTAKLALVLLVVRGLRARPRPRPTAARQSRTVAILALINLLLTSSWLVLVRFFD